MNRYKNQRYRNNNTLLKSTNKDTEKEFNETIAKNKPTQNPDLPDSFDGRSVWKGLLQKVAYQGSCGSCWACSSVVAFASRFNIQILGKYIVELSYSNMAVCDFENRWSEIETIRKFKERQQKYHEVSDSQRVKLCDLGNTLIDAYRFLYIFGIPTSKCFPNNLLLKIPLPDCRQFDAYPSEDLCKDGSPMRRFRISHYYGLNNSEKDIRNDIYSWGPLATGMELYDDFYEFDHKSGKVYAYDGKSASLGGHAVVLVGWGVRDSVPYWLVQNSWGEAWGDGGFFKIRRGTNECKIEENCVGCLPDYFFPYQAYEQSYDWGDKAQFAQRNRIENELLYEHGGIDPNTGYTWQHVARFPGLNLKPYVDEKDIPNFIKDAFVAGKVSIYWKIMFKKILIGTFIFLILVLLYRKLRT